MNRNEMDTLVQAELTTIPPGGISQNIYRAAYQQAGLNELACSAEIPGAPDAAHAITLDAVKRDDPSFTPQLI